MPTSANKTFTYDYLQPAQSPELADVIRVKLKASTVFPKGCLLGEIGTTGVFGPYDNAASDGTEVAKLLLKYPCATDASNNITYGGASGGGEWGESEKQAPAYYVGVFFGADLPQSSTGAIDSAGVADLGKLLYGTSATGLLKVG